MLLLTLIFEIYFVSYIFRFKSDEERIPVHLIVDQTFPSLLNIFNKLVQIANPPVDVADYIKLICKIFWSSIYVRLFMSIFHPVSFFFFSFQVILWHSKRDEFELPTFAFIIKVTSCFNYAYPGRKNNTFPCMSMRVKLI